MAWTQTLESSTSSPRGFWPNPNKEKFLRKQAPWRKTKKKPQENFCFYEWTNQSFNYSAGAEVSTSNRFDLLSEEDHWKDMDPSTDQIIPTEDDVVLPDYVSFNKFMQNDYLFYDCNYYLYGKNKNFVQVISPVLLP